MTNHLMHNIHCPLSSMRFVLSVDGKSLDMNLLQLQLRTGNLQAAHWICNQKKSNKIGNEVRAAVKKINIIDGEW